MERRIRQEVKSESYFPRRFFLSCLFFSGTRPAPPGARLFYSLFFPPFFSLPRLSRLFRLALLGRPAREETESRVKTVECRRVNPRVDSLRGYGIARAGTHTHSLCIYITHTPRRSPSARGRARFQNGKTIFFFLGETRDLSVRQHRRLGSSGGFQVSVA